MGCLCPNPLNIFKHHSHISSSYSMLKSVYVIHLDAKNISVQKNIVKASKKAPTCHLKSFKNVDFVAIFTVVLKVSV